jgi:hypothetical protein
VMDKISIRGWSGCCERGFSEKPQYFAKWKDHGPWECTEHSQVRLYCCKKLDFTQNASKKTLAVLSLFWKQSDIGFDLWVLHNLFSRDICQRTCINDSVKQHKLDRCNISRILFDVRLNLTILINGNPAQQLTLSEEGSPSRSRKRHSRGPNRRNPDIQSQHNSVQIPLKSQALMS